MLLTPIFDQLADEFAAKDIHILGLYEQTPATISREAVQDGMKFLAGLGEALAQDEAEDEPTAVLEVVQETADAGTKHTLYDATHLAVIKPAIPEMVKLPRVPTSVAETLKQADKDLGLDDFDKAFREADRALDAPTVITSIPRKMSPKDVAEFKKKLDETQVIPKVEVALPKRQNKRNKNRNRNRSSNAENRAA